MDNFHVLCWSQREETSAAGLQFMGMRERMASWLLNKQLALDLEEKGASRWKPVG